MKFNYSDNKSITLSSLAVQIELDESLFQIYERTRNGSVRGQAIKKGISPIYGSFQEVNYF